MCSTLSWFFLTRANFVVMSCGRATGRSHKRSSPAQPRPHALFTAHICHRIFKCPNYSTLFFPIWEAHVHSSITAHIFKIQNLFTTFRTIVVLQSVLSRVRLTTPHPISARRLTKRCKPRGHCWRPPPPPSPLPATLSIPSLGVVHHTILPLISAKSFITLQHPLSSPPILN